MSLSVDLNADLGEGFGPWTMGDDDGLLEVITSANVACGFHAGDPSIMARVCERAVAVGVAIGAHVSYRDLVGFGRRDLDVEPGALRDDVLYQLGALAGFARAAGGRVSYVKPHGALYHRACAQPDAAAAVVEAVAAFGDGVGVLALPGSALLSAAASAGVPAFAEGYLDRGYEPGGGLLHRSRPGAVIDDSAAIAARAVRIAVDGEVTASTGEVVALSVVSLCAHGDTPSAVASARAARRALESAGVTVRAFAAA
ncbi:LamB/YcsF family protein [Acidiferrimicrobium sp. IK]|nr:5-oxoprolinase subunit PxpA [Acidiferrimicrobium sp. IK]MCU4184277.1 LamB/YcsF family protein [Acidiferrimicrobium sp. IK]